VGVSTTWGVRESKRAGEGTGRPVRRGESVKNVRESKRGSSVGCVGREPHRDGFTPSLVKFSITVPGTSFTTSCTRSRFTVSKHEEEIDGPVDGI
jgi:hypothetical protein